MHGAGTAQRCALVGLVGLAIGGAALVFGLRGSATEEVFEADLLDRWRYTGSVEVAVETELRRSEGAVADEARWTINDPAALTLGFHSTVEAEQPEQFAAALATFELLPSRDTGCADTVVRSLAASGALHIFFEFTERREVLWVTAYYRREGQVDALIEPPVDQIFPVLAGLRWIDDRSSVACRSDVLVPR